MGDATARLDAALLGLDGFVVVATAEVRGELELLVETTADLVGCPRCGAVARAKDRRPTWVRDLPLGGRPVVLCWWKRVWSCPHPLCEVKTTGQTPSPDRDTPRRPPSLCQSRCYYRPPTPARREQYGAALLWKVNRIKILGLRGHRWQSGLRVRVRGGRLGWRGRLG